MVLLTAPMAGLAVVDKVVGRGFGTVVPPTFVNEFAVFGAGAVAGLAEFAVPGLAAAFALPVGAAGLADIGLAGASAGLRCVRVDLTVVVVVLISPLARGFFSDLLCKWWVGCFLSTKLCKCKTSYNKYLTNC